MAEGITRDHRGLVVWFASWPTGVPATCTEHGVITREKTTVAEPDLSRLMRLALGSAVFFTGLQFGQELAHDVLYPRARARKTTAGKKFKRPPWAKPPGRQKRKLPQGTLEPLERPTFSEPDWGSYGRELVTRFVQAHDVPFSQMQELPLDVVTDAELGILLGRKRYRK